MSSKRNSCAVPRDMSHQGGNSSAASAGRNYYAALMICLSMEKLRREIGPAVGAMRPDGRTPYEISLEWSRHGHGAPNGHRDRLSLSGTVHVAG